MSENKPRSKAMLKKHIKMKRSEPLMQKNVWVYWQELPNVDIQTVNPQIGIKTYIKLKNTNQIAGRMKRDQENKATNHL